MSSTTIKVPKTLRDRLADRAQKQGVTLAGAIERALDESDERRFWEAVSREHSTLSDVERDVYLRSGGTDDLADALDDEISERGEW